MQMELRCPQCPYLFRASSTTPAEAILEHLIDEGPWLGLAQGETFGDMIRTALKTRGVIYCPECGTAVSISKRIRPPKTRSRASKTTEPGA
jgi:rubredoxin